MGRLTVCLLIFFATISNSFSQDSLLVRDKSAKTFLIKNIAPISLVGLGLFVEFSNGKLSKENLQYEIRKNNPDFHNSIDDYIQYVPAIAMYTMDIFGNNSKNGIVEHSKIFVKAHLLNATLTFVMKRGLGHQRPNGGEHSFPSGHTSSNFVSACVLDHEYRHISPWISVAGYSVATTVGVLRVLNNAHWVSDVLVGAGVGILSTNIVYLTHQYKPWFGKKKKSSSQALLLPYYSEGKNMGLVFHKNF